MTDKEMKHLSRRDLLELLVDQMKENQRLEALLKEKEELLKSREIDIENAGSVAEAALSLNKVFSAAQDAADQYLMNIKRMEAETEKRCRAMLRYVEKECRKEKEKSSEKEEPSQKEEAGKPEEDA